MNRHNIVPYLAAAGIALSSTTAFAQPKEPECNPKCADEFCKKCTDDNKENIEKMVDGRVVQKIEELIFKNKSKYKECSTLYDGHGRCIADQFALELGLEDFTPGYCTGIKTRCYDTTGIETVNDIKERLKEHDKRISENKEDIGDLNSKLDAHLNEPKPASPQVVVNNNENSEETINLFSLGLGLGYEFTNSHALVFDFSGCYTPEVLHLCLNGGFRINPDDEVYSTSEPTITDTKRRSNGSVSSVNTINYDLEETVSKNGYVGATIEFPLSNYIGLTALEIAFPLTVNAYIGTINQDKITRVSTQFYNTDSQPTSEPRTVDGIESDEDTYIGIAALAGISLGIPVTDFLKPFIQAQAGVLGQAKDNGKVDPVVRSVAGLKLSF